jgi:ligand-binding sensor domain-containing protein
MRARAQSFVALVSLLACCAYTFALDPTLNVSQYSHTAWRVRDGFAKGEIDSIAQTADGYLWLGTEFGLFQFDGVRTTPWQPPGGQSLPPGAIVQLLVSRKGTLWIGTAKGLASWNASKLTRYAELEGQGIYALLEDREGTVWAGAGGAPLSGKLCAIRAGSVDCAGGDGRFGLGVLALHEDVSGRLWAGVVDGLWRWRPGPPKFYPLTVQLDGIQALADDADGALLVGWKGAMYRFLNGKSEPYPVSTGPQFHAYKVIRDQSGGMWIGTRDRGLVHVHQGRADSFSAADGLSGDNV